MAQDHFASGFLDAVAKIHDIQRRKRKDEWDEDDRGIEKDLLSHRLRTIKINEKVLARKAAMENAALLEGQPEANFPWSGQEKDQRTGPSPLGPGFGTAQYPKQEPPPVQIPGIEEIGVPPATYQAQSLEEQLRVPAKDLRTRARGRGYELNRGESVAVPGATENDPFEVIEGQPWEPNPRAPRAPTRSVGRRRNPNGTYTEWDEFYDEETKTTRKGPERQVVPPRPSSSGGTTGPGGGTATMLSEQETADAVELFKKGYPIERIPTSALGIRLATALDKAGLDVTQALADQQIYEGYIKRLGSGDQAKILDAANGATQALADMELLFEDPDATNEDIDTMAGVLRTYIPLIKTGGDPTTNAGIANAEKEFLPGIGRMWKGNKAVYGPKIKALRKHLTYRTRSIRGSFLPSGAEGGPAAPPRPRGVTPSAAGGGGGGGSDVAPLPDTGAGMPDTPNAIQFTAAMIKAELIKQKRVPPKTTADQLDEIVIGIMADPEATKELFAAQKKK